MPSGDKFQGALRRFVMTWRDYADSEKSEARTFLNQHFACCGSDRQEMGAEFESFSAAGFMDLHWPGILLVEMKGSGGGDQDGAAPAHAADLLAYPTPSTPPPSELHAVIRIHDVRLARPGD